MRILRYGAFALGGVVAVVAVLAAFIAATFDAARIKTELATLVQQHKQRTLRIDGEFSLAFWPSLGVRAGQLALSERASETVFAEVGSAHVSLEILPLLRKRLVIDRLELEGVKATLVRRADGTLNIDDLLGQEEAAQDAPVQFDVAGVRLADSQLTWRDDKLGRTVVLTALALRTDGLGNAARGHAELATRIAVDAPRVDLGIRFAGDYDYALADQRYALGQFTASLEGRADALQALAATATAARLSFAPGASTLGVDQLKLSGKARVGKDGVELEVSAPQLALAGDKASGAALELVAKLAGEARGGEAKVRLSGLEGSSQALKIAAVALDADLRQGPAVLKLVLGGPLEADFNARTLALAQLVGKIDAAHPDMPMKQVSVPVEGSARADFAKSQGAAQLAARLDDSRIRADVRATRFEPLALMFDLDIDKLDLDKYFPPKPPGAPGAPAAGEAGGRLDLSALKGLDLNGAIKIGQLRAARIKASDISLKLRAKDGRLAVAPLAARLYEGSLAGSASVTAGGQFAAAPTLTNVAVLPLLQDLAGKDLLEGRGTIALDLAAQGDSVAALKRSLGGSARMALRDGALRGINLAKTVRELRARVSAGGVSNVAASQTEKTDFSELTASFRIAQGIARNDDLSAKSPYLRLGGAGTINLVDSSLDYLAKVSFVATSTGQQGKDLAQVKGLTVPVKLAGPLEQPAWSVDVGGLLADTARQKADEALQAQREKLEQKARDKLGDTLGESVRGLFGR